MNALVTGLCDIERELAHEKGEFALFACFQSPHIQSQWDVVVSAAWAPRHDRTTLQLFLVEEGFIIASHDYWHFVKELFPPDTEFAFLNHDGDLHIRASRFLRNDPKRPNKRSRNVIVRITREALDDYIYVDDPHRSVVERKLVSFLKSQLRSIVWEHSEPAHKTAPVQRLPAVTPMLFQRPAATA